MSQQPKPEEIPYIIRELLDMTHSLRDGLYRRPEGVLYRLEVLERSFSVLEAKIAMAAGLGAVIGGMITAIILKFVNLGG